MANIIRSVKLTEAQERQRLSWQFRVIERTRGNQTLLGCLILAILGKAASNPPRFVGLCEIDQSGMIWAPFQSVRHPNKQCALCPVVTTVELTRQLNRLADDLKLTDKERIEMFDEARKWISVDHREIPSNLSINRREI